MEADIIVEGIGAWANFDELEESLILDELIILNEAIAKKRHAEFKALAAVQGIDVPDDDSSLHSNEELPPELIAREKEWRAKKEAMRDESMAEEMSAFGLGYSKK